MESKAPLPDVAQEADKVEESLSPVNKATDSTVKSPVKKATDEVDVSSVRANVPDLPSSGESVADVLTHGAEWATNPWHDVGWEACCCPCILYGRSHERLRHLQNGGDPKDFHGRGCGLPCLTCCLSPFC